MTFVPRRSLKAEENEIARAYKVTGNMIQPISFYVPRRAESFQSDIFPPARSSVPALSGKDFFNGKQAHPNLVSLEDGSGLKAPVSAPAPLSAPSSPLPPTPAAAPEPRALQKEEATPAPRRLPSPERKAPSTTATPLTAPSSTFEARKEPSRPSSPVKSTYKPSVATEAVKEIPSSAPSHANGGSSDARRGANVEHAHDGEKAELKRKVEELTDKLGERESLIRSLELEIEKLKINQAKVREAIGF